MYQKEQKEYLDRFFIREFVNNEKGYSKLSVGIHLQSFYEQMSKHMDSSGYVNIAISKRRQPSPKGLTHYAVVDNWKKKKSETEASMQTQGVNTAQQYVDDISLEDIPF